MSFLETPTFPTDISYGSTGGPTYSTSVVVLKSGYEKRNINWSYPRHEYDVAYGLKKMEDLEELIEFFHAVMGKAHGFRFKDHADYMSCELYNTPAATDQSIGTGDASETEFQLIKTYTKGALSLTRNIKKPVSGTVLIALDGVAQGSGWSVDTTTGIVTFTSPPGSSVDITAGYEFDVPVRFDTDKISTVFEDYKAGAASVPIIEIRV